MVVVVDTVVGVAAGKGGDKCGWYAACRSTLGCVVPPASVAHVLLA